MELHSRTVSGDSSLPSPAGILHTLEPTKRSRVFLGLVEAASILIFGTLAFLFWVAHFNNYDRDLLSDNVYHRSERPFVYRTLLPTTVNVLTRFFPSSARKAAESFVSSNSAMRSMFTIERSSSEVRGRLKFEKHFPIETAIALALMFSCLLGFLLMTGRLYWCFYDGAPWFAAFVPAMAALGFVPWISYTSHPYDLTTLLLSSLFYWYIAKENWRGLLTVFFLSCVNKETAILNTIVFAVYQWHRGMLFRRRTVLLITAQAAIFLGLKVTINYLFRANKGGLLEFHLLDTNASLISHWIQAGYSMVGLVTFAAILTGIFHSWTEKPLLFRCGLSVIPVLALLGLLFGVFDEWRQYTDAYTPLLMLILGSIGWIFGARPRRISEAVA